SKFFFPRSPLLIQLERRCAFPDCGLKNQISLTKAEAIEYRGFNCAQCDSWNEDQLSRLEMPDAWCGDNDARTQ
ncbi:MAG TPA: hypothetical protein VK557_18995, partial [Pyrinomonadaceae bacterium]|nr:hypothetical protein [Pyrinomonadaceae bacterium]